MARANKTNSDSTAVAVIEEAVPASIKFADVLVPVANLNAQRAMQAFQEVIETPFISGAAAAEAETVVTILRVIEGEVEDLQNPGVFIPQWLFLLKLQTALEYTDTSREIKKFAAGDIVMLGLQRRGKIRDRFADLVRSLTENGEVIPNMLIISIPNKKPGLHPATAFRQIVK